MKTDKLMGELFWVDRWTGSSAFALTLEQRGLYREMLSQAWRREARLPNDPAAIRRIVGATAQEWARCWPRVKKYWRVEGAYLVNDTQQVIYEKTKARHAVASLHGLKAALARHNGDARAKPG